MERRKKAPGDWIVSGTVFVVGFVVYYVTARRVFTLDGWEGRVPDGYTMSRWTFWLILLIAAAAVVVVHEAGHALAGALMGFRSFRVVIGSGPTVARFPVGSTKVELCAFPFTGGLTEMATRRDDALWSRHALSIIGGPLAPVLVAIVLMRWDAPSITLEVVRLSAIAIVVYTTILSLLPYRSGGMQSDGMHLVECVRQHPETRRMLLVAHDALSLRDAVTVGDAAALGELRASHDPVVASAACVEAGDLDRAIEIARTALADPHPAQVDILRNNLAAALALREAPGDIDEALHHVSGIDLESLGPAAHDTVGLALLRDGQPAAAVPYLKVAFADTTLLVSTRIQVAAHLAEAAYASGDAHLGRRALAVAVRDGAGDPHVERAVEAAMGPEVEVIRSFWADSTGDDHARAAELAGALGTNLRATLAVLEMVDLDADPELDAITSALRAVRVTRT